MFGFDRDKKFAARWRRFGGVWPKANFFGRAAYFSMRIRFGLCSCRRCFASRGVRKRRFDSHFAYVKLAALVCKSNCSDSDANGGEQFAVSRSSLPARSCSYVRRVRSSATCSHVAREVETVGPRHERDHIRLASGGLRPRLQSLRFRCLSSGDYARRMAVDGASCRNPQMDAAAHGIGGRRAAARHKVYRRSATARASHARSTLIVGHRYTDESHATARLQLCRVRRLVDTRQRRRRICLA